jgi:hypothetical protein
VFALLRTLPVVGDVFRVLEDSTRQATHRYRSSLPSKPLNSWQKEYSNYSPQF